MGRAVHLVAQPGLLVLVGHLEPGPALEVQRPEAGDPAGLRPRARVLQGQLEGVIDAELGPGGTHGPGPLRRPAPSPSAPAGPTPARRPRPVPSSRLLDSPAPWSRPRPYITAPPPPAFSRPELPSAEQTSDRAFSRPDRAGLAAPPSGRLGERQRVPLSEAIPGSVQGLAGVATRQPFRPELEPSASQPAPRVLRRLLGTLFPPLLTTALHGRGIIATVQMWKKAQRAYVACILLQFCLHADGKVVF